VGLRHGLSAGALDMWGGLWACSSNQDSAYKRPEEHQHREGREYEVVVYLRLGLSFLAVLAISTPDSLLYLVQFSLILPNLQLLLHNCYSVVRDRDSLSVVN